MIKSWRVRKRFVLVPLAMLITGCMLWALYNVHENSLYVRPVGKLVMGDNRAYDKAIVRYCEAWSRGEACQAHVLGSDDRYIYALLYWTNGGSSTMDEARYTYTSNPLRITGQTLVGDDNRHPSVESIYPRPVYRAGIKIWFSWVRFE